MVMRWLLRLLLVVGAFFLGIFASFFLLFLVTWDQEVFDVLQPIAGFAAAAFAFFKSKTLTQQTPKEARSAG